MDALPSLSVTLGARGLSTARLHVSSDRSVAGRGKKGRRAKVPSDACTRICQRHMQQEMARQASRAVHAVHAVRAVRADHDD